MLDTGGTFTVLHSFGGGSDGCDPVASLIHDASGNLYGTTAGGDNSDYGTVFKLDTTGKETVLHKFSGSADGAYPFGGLIMDRRGTLYGTTSSGGSSNQGTVYKVDASGSAKVLHNFAGVPDGAFPYYGSLLMDKSGNLYGVTESGGDAQCTNGYGCGTVFKVSKTGKETVLYSFTGELDACFPYGTLVNDSKGNLYGTTLGCGYGTVYKLSKRGILTVLHDFKCTAGGDGCYPYAGVIRDKKGNLYGDTVSGGTAGGAGAAYELSRNGTMTLLHSFTGSDGQSPYGGVIRDKNGNFYGTTVFGGSSGYGTVWKLTP